MLEKIFQASWTRCALNFKRVHSGLDHETGWTELTEISQVRKSLGAAPCRKHYLDDSEFYTLLAIVDHSSKQVTGDSFEIALYLEAASTSRAELCKRATRQNWSEFAIQGEKRAEMLIQF
ncbi:hypothetical protein diail_4554 [Diaporthe ilicicola]|nr:hypothetical protein diail_4554 [Diaporthe ilicicola]